MKAFEDSLYKVYVWGRSIHKADSTIMQCGLFKGHGLYVRLIKD